MSRRTSDEARRNTIAILAALDRARRPGLRARLGLELGAGGGEHTVALARRFPELTWQPTDPDPVQRASITAWLAHEGLTAVRPPIALDATVTPWALATDEPLAMILAVHLLHLLPSAAIPALLDEAARRLATGGLLLIHDAFLDEVGRPPSARMADFDQRLRAQDPRAGLPVRAALEAAAARAGLRLADDTAYDTDQRTVVYARPARPTAATN